MVRIVRPRSDKPRWAVGAACGLAALVIGYAGAARVFRPGAHGTENGDVTENVPGESVNSGVAATTPSEPARDAGMAVTVEAAPAPSTPRVGIRVMRTQLQSCGDGEELNVRGEACDSLPELEQALRARLAQLGNCPSAEIAATQPEATLSVGLRIDFPRRRVTALPGRSSSLRNALTYLACARSFFDHSEEVWRVHAAHARYLYYFAVRFGPVLIQPAAPAATPAPSLTPVARDATGTPGSVPATPAPTGATPGAATPTPLPAASATPSVGGTSASASASPPVVDGAIPLRRPETATIVWERVNLRDAPRGGRVVASVDRGTEITVYARHRGGWWQTNWRGNWAWIFGQAIGRAH